MSYGYDMYPAEYAQPHASPYYIPTHNPSYMHSPEYIHPDSVTGQLGLTPEELAPIKQEHREFLSDKFVQPPTRPTTYYNHHTPTEPLPPSLNLAPTTLPQSMADAISQLGITPAELEELDRECICEQAELLAIQDKSWWVARREQELRGEQSEGNREKPGEEMEQPEEMGEMQEFGSGEQQNETRWVPTYSTSHSQLILQVHEMPDEHTLQLNIPNIVRVC
jgi:hypothetical protein